MSEPLDLDGIEARANAATPGPWTVEAGGDMVRGNGGRNWVGDVGASQEPMGDAEFIAHAREDVPALVAEVRALRAKVAELLPEVEMWREHFLDDVREVERRNASASSESTS